MILFWLLVTTASANDCVSLASVLGQLRHEPIDRSNHLLVIDGPDGSRSSVLYRYMDAERRVISIDAAQTAQEFRGRGGFTVLFQEMMRREPQMQEIESTLMYENLRIAKEHDDGVGSEFERCVRMVAFTPAYKTRVRFGFSRITECGLTTFGIILRVAR